MIFLNFFLFAAFAFVVCSAYPAGYPFASGTMYNPNKVVFMGKDSNFWGYNNYPIRHSTHRGYGGYYGRGYGSGYGGGYGNGYGDSYGRGLGDYDYAGQGLGYGAGFAPGYGQGLGYGSGLGYGYGDGLGYNYRK